MRDVYAGVIYWNDGPDILRMCLKALVDNGIKPICIDGAYKDFPLEKDQRYHSTDGCIAVAKEFAWHHIDCPAAGWRDQVEKRNQYLEYCLDGDWIIVVDADEVMRPMDNTGIFGLLQDDVYCVHENRMEQPARGFMTATIRVYRMFSDLRYKYQHCRLYRLNQHDSSDMASGIVTSAHGNINSTRAYLPIILDHYKYMRSPERKEQKHKFYIERPETQYKYDFN